MDFITVLIISSAIYGTLFFFDMFFKTCAHYPYIQFLKNTGFEIGVFRAKWKTTFFNRYFLRMSSGHSRSLNWWFEAGVYVCLMLLPFVIGMVLIATFQLFMNSHDGMQREVVLQVNLPGINIPSSELGYYVSVLFICSLVHEFGHALAAVKEDVHVIDVGFSVIFILPVAFVNVSNEKLSTVGHWRALRFLCAGVWHNVVLVVFAGLVSGTLPVLLAPLYTTGTGIVITDITSSSPLMGEKGFEVNDVITQINDCYVKNEETWQECLSRARTEKMGYCVSADVHQLDESAPLTQLASGVLDCCNAHNTRNMCFEYLELSEGIMELPQHMCLPARQIIEESEFNCYSHARYCPNPLHCIKPMLSNTTSLMLIKRLHKNSVLYLGHPADVFVTVNISPFIPKYAYPGPKLAARIDRLLTYIVVFSSGLAVLNLVPCLFFDGEHITKSLSVILLRNRVKRHSITTFAMAVNILGTLMIFINVVHSSWSYIFQM